MNTRPSQRRPSAGTKREGFSLVEVTVALGLAAFGLLAIFALLPTGVNSNSDSVKSTLAAGLATTIVNDLQSANYGAPSPVYGINPDTVATDPPAMFFRADGGTDTPANADFKGVTAIPKVAGKISQVRVVISWPAQAANPVNSFEVVTSIDRNAAP